uniref:mRNA n=1 Tax=Oulactis sp. TaxID=2093647 RepID=A0A8J9X9C4_OULSP|nr:mRNA [Oulactis sp. MM-2018]
MDICVKTLQLAFLLTLAFSVALSQNCLMRGGCHKVEESSRSQVDFFLCGDSIYYTFIDVCKIKKRRKREVKAAVNILVNRRESSKFLSRRKRRTYDIVEECCHEGCRVEEVHEYCHVML